MSESRLIDVAGIGVEVVAASAAYARCAAGRLGDEPATGEPEVRIDLGPIPPEVPEGAVRDEVEGIEGHTLDDRIWMGFATARARIDGTAVVLGGPLETDRDEDILDDLLQFAVAVAATTPSRIMVHGAVVSRGADALLLVGQSGSGKSTLAASALVGGWDLLGDDLAVIDAPSLDVRSVRRPAYVPADIAARHGLDGTGEERERARTKLPLDALASGTRRLVGVVAVDHGDVGSVEPLGVGDPSVLDDALAMPPFPAVMRRQLAAGAAILGVPAVLLSHAADVERRVERAVELLDDAWARLAGS
ncbi:MAG: hypothetical protein AAF548_11290 [Actinomycetota bacterium]